MLRSIEQRGRPQFQEAPKLDVHLDAQQERILLAIFRQGSHSGVFSDLREDPSEIARALSALELRRLISKGLSGYTITRQGAQVAQALDQQPR
jgi:hypothetical protein